MMLHKLFRFSLVLILAVTACTPRTEPLCRADRIVKELHDPSSNYVVVVAHRGDWRNYPENSLPAIESCIRMGVDVVEIDLKLTKDSVLVLSHDRTLNRCTTGRQAMASAAPASRCLRSGKPWKSARTGSWST